MSCSRLIFAFRGLAGVGDQLHDVVVVDDGGGEEDELEVELVDFGVGSVSPGFSCCSFRRWAVSR